MRARCQYYIRTNLFHGLHQRLHGHLVFGHANERRLRVGGGIQNRMDRFHSLDGAKVPIECRRTSSTLNVAERRDTGIDAQLLADQILEVLGADTM